MKAVLQSIRPKWTEKILKGIKTKELRKSKPSHIEYPFKVYMYETKPGAGAVIGEYTCEGTETSERPEHFVDGSCVPLEDIKVYMGKGKISGWDISNVILYSKPEPLSNFGLSRPPQSWCYVECCVENKKLLD